MRQVALRRCESTKRSLKLLCSGDNSGLERRIANKAFVYTYIFSRYRNTRMSALNRALRDDETQQEFKGVMIDTESKRSSVISLRKYRAYCREVNVPAAIDKGDARTIRAIGGRTRTIW